VWCIEVVAAFAPLHGGGCSLPGIHSGQLCGTRVCGNELYFCSPSSSDEDGLPELPLFLTARSHWVVFARVWSGVIESIAGGNHPIVI
jgi:hypothetical protein